MDDYAVPSFLLGTEYSSEECTEECKGLGKDFLVLFTSGNTPSKPARDTLMATLEQTMLRIMNRHFPNYNPKQGAEARIISLTKRELVNDILSVWAKVRGEVPSVAASASAAPSAVEASPINAVPAILGEEDVTDGEYITLGVALIEYLTSSGDCCREALESLKKATESTIAAGTKRKNGRHQGREAKSIHVPTGPSKVVAEFVEAPSAVASLDNIAGTSTAASLDNIAVTSAMASKDDTTEESNEEDHKMTAKEAKTQELDDVNNLDGVPQQLVRSSTGSVDNKDDNDKDNIRDSNDNKDGTGSVDGTGKDVNRQDK